MTKILLYYDNLLPNVLTIIFIIIIHQLLLRFTWFKKYQINPNFIILIVKMTRE